MLMLLLDHRQNSLPYTIYYFHSFIDSDCFFLGHVMQFIFSISCEEYKCTMNEQTFVNFWHVYFGQYPSTIFCFIDISDHSQLVYIENASFIIFSVIAVVIYKPMILWLTNNQRGMLGKPQEVAKLKFFVFNMNCIMRVARPTRKGNWTFCVAHFWNNFFFF